MRRPLSPVLRPLADTARTLARDWNAFWYAPADPTLLGAIRILTGLMLLYTHAVWGLALGSFFGPSGWLSVELVRTVQLDQFACSFWWWVPGEWAWLAHTLSMVALGLFTIGLWTRVTSILALIVATSYAHRVPMATFGLDQINIMLTLYLAIGPAARRFRLIAGYRGAVAGRRQPRARPPARGPTWR